jgi:peptide deformylase
LAILPILEAPHPALSRKAIAVRAEDFGPDLAQRLSDMAETMYAAPGVGLAAPQVGDNRRMLVANLGGDEDTESRDGLIRMVNPVIVTHSEETITWDESCLSVPEFEIDVVRSERVRVRWQSSEGEVHDEWFEAFPSVVLQHEIDHLEGVTLLDRSSRLKRSRYLARQKKRRAGPPQPGA